MRKFIAAAALSLAAFTAQAEPSLYGCQGSGDGLFFVISPETGEFMIFDHNGSWVNRGQFSRESTDTGVPYFFAVVGNSSIGWTKLNNNVWRLVIVDNNSNQKSELNCR
jgi:hypothetical protein